MLFSKISAAHPADLPAPPAMAAWVPPNLRDTALVVNLPGAEGVLAGLAYAQHGFRPVPLYNAVPVLGINLGVAVNIGPIITALEQQTASLAGLTLPANAPPVFLLDANRGGGGLAPPPDWFDNRSVSFTTDFPSAKFLFAAGIRRVVLVQSSPALQSDLTHTLRRWQDGGLAILLKTDPTMESPAPLAVPKPSWFGLAFQRALVALGLRRNSSGGFGGWVPDPSSGSG